MKIYSKTKNWTCNCFRWHNYRNKRRHEYRASRPSTSSWLPSRGGGGRRWGRRLHHWKVSNTGDITLLCLHQLRQVLVLLKCFLSVVSVKWTGYLWRWRADPNIGMSECCSATTFDGQPKLRKTCISRWRSVMRPLINWSSWRRLATTLSCLSSRWKTRLSDIFSSSLCCTGVA